MKKILLSCLAIVMSVSMFAINYTSKVTIALYDGTYVPNFVVGESSDAEFAGGALVNGYFAPVQDLAAAPLALYAYYGGVEYENLILDNLTNVPMGIKTSNASSYKLLFTNLQGAVSIFDTNTGQTIDCSANYNFTIEDSEKNSIINDRFVLKYAPFAPELCFNYNVLTVNGHDGESLVIKQGDTEIDNVAALGNTYSKDLSAYNGRLVVILNGQAYQIDANPATTPAN